MPRHKSPKGQRSVALAVYLPPKMLERLRETALKDRRTASNQALVYIERCLDEATG